MKTLEDHTLLYDNDCPLCNVYTSGFIKAKMLDDKGRKSFHLVSKEEQNFIDVKRATNEIALVDNKNKTVIYGIDSLLKVIGNSFPRIEKIGGYKPIHFLLKKLYSFISYNRKVIIPSKRKSEPELQCVPDFNYKYRFIYIIFATIITTLVLFKFSNSITILSESNMRRELLLAIGQIIFQSSFLLNTKRVIIIDYVGNLMTVSLIGCFFLIPLLIINSFVLLPQHIMLLGFGITVLLMFLEHSRRVTLLELPLYLSYTWILYRIIALIIIFNI